MIMMMMGTVMDTKNLGSDQTNNSENLVTPLPALRMVENELDGLIIRTFQRVIEPMMGNLICKVMSSDINTFQRVMEPMMENLIRKVMSSDINTFQRVMEPMMENLIRRVVKEEIKLPQAELLNKIQNVNEEGSTSRSGSLELQFLDNVSSPVLTGKDIKGEGGAPVRIALVDVSTGQVVDNGPEASAKVEVVVLEADHEDHQKLDKNISGEREKKRPLLSGNIIHLKQGVGHLGNVKFKHDKIWMRSCECMLVARVMDNFGIRVQEAKTGLFTVMDSRNKLYEKHYPPSLSDHVWRLENISRNGALHKRLNEAGIFTVKDFLISLFLDPEKLRKILDTNATTWKVLTDHAQTCMVDEKVHLYSSREGETVVVFDAVGRLKGRLCNYQYIPVAEPSEAEKAEMLKSIASAFKHWENVVTFDNEASLLHCLSQISNGIFSPNIPRLGSPSDCNFDIRETSHVFDHIQPGTSSQYSVPSISCFDGTSSFAYSGSLSTYNYFNDQAQDVLDQGLEYPSFDLGTVDEDTGFYDHMWLLSFDSDCQLDSENSQVQFCSHQQSSTSYFHRVDDKGPSSKNAKKRWRMVAVSVKKKSIRKRFVNLIGAHVQKKPRHC